MHIKYLGRNMTPFWDYYPQLKVSDFVTKCFFYFQSMRQSRKDRQNHCVHTEECHKNNETQMLAFHPAPSKHYG